MGSTLATLRGYLADQIAAENVTIGSDPSSTLLDDYINKSIRKIVRRDKPRELLTSTPITADITISTNVVTIPTTIFIIKDVYYKNSSGNWTEMRETNDIKNLIQAEAPNNFYDTTNTGDPTLYVVRGSSLVFNKHFSRTESAAINLEGIKVPTTLSDDTDTTELPIDYDSLITYESAILYAERDDDEENIARWSALAEKEKSELVINLQMNDTKTWTLDPYYYTNNFRTFGDPGVYFSS